MRGFVVPFGFPIDNRATWSWVRAVYEAIALRDTGIANEFRAFCTENCRGYPHEQCCWPVEEAVRKLEAGEKAKCDAAAG